MSACVCHAYAKEVVWISKRRLYDDARESLYMSSVFMHSISLSVHRVQEESGGLHCGWNGFSARMCGE